VQLRQQLQRMVENDLFAASIAKVLQQEHAANRLPSAIEFLGRFCPADVRQVTLYYVPPRVREAVRALGVVPDECFGPSCRNFDLLLDHMRFVQYCAAVTKSALLMSPPATAAELELESLALVSGERVSLANESFGVDVWSTATSSVEAAGDRFPVVRELDAWERSQLMVFPACLRGLRSGERLIVESLAEFRANFDAMTSGMLRYLEWDDSVLVAGGAVLACTLKSFDRAAVASGAGGDGDGGDGAWNRADIDIFLVGPLSPAQVESKVRRIRDQVLRATGLDESQVVVVRTKNCFTLACCYPYRHVQVIVRPYSSKLEVLASFDLDCVMVGYDGERVLATRRWCRALSTGVNLVSRRQFQTQLVAHEARYIKYATRGFGLLVYATTVDCSAESAAAALEAPHLVALLSKIFRLQLRLGSKTAAKRSGFGTTSNNTTSDTTISSTSGGAAPLYESAYIPWGRQWNAEAVRKALARKRSTTGSAATFFIFGSLEYVLEHGAQVFAAAAAEPHHGGE